MGPDPTMQTFLLFILLIMYDALSIIHIIVSILLIVTILLQQKGASLGSGFGGGGGEASFEHIRRGSEKKLYQATMVLALAFIVLSSLHLFN